jgi:aminopeptidase
MATGRSLDILSNGASATSPDVGFTPVQLDRLAEVLVWALQTARAHAGPGGRYEPGDTVLLPYDSYASAAAERVYARLLQLGLNVVVQPNPHFKMDQLYYQHAEQHQLEHLPEWRKAKAADMEGLIALRAPESLTYLKDCDPKKVNVTSKIGRELRNLQTAKELQGKFGWTLTVLPTPILALTAGLSMAEYTEQVANACYLNYEDPVAKWQDTMAKVEIVKDWLNRLDIELVHVESDCGRTDLRIALGEQRQWLGGSGHNIPSFEVFVSPQAGQAEGVFYANEPSFKLGNLVRGVRLEFRGGEVVAVDAEEGRDFVQSRVDLDEGSKLIGEFSLTDRRFSEITKFMAHTLFDENVGGPTGNSHIAIGMAYLDSYTGSDELTEERIKELGFSRSAEHWDLVTTDNRTVTAWLRSGAQVVIYKDGQFLCPHIK